MQSEILKLFKGKQQETDTSTNFLQLIPIPQKTVPRVDEWDCIIIKASEYKNNQKTKGIIYTGKYFDNN